MNRKILSHIALLASVFVSAGFAAQAQCTRWDVNGEWDAVILNLGTHRLDVVQTGGGTVSGEARGFYSAGIGEILGTLNGNELTFSIHWKSAVSLQPNGANTEAFKGKIGADGKIEGGAVLLPDKTFDFNNHKWTSSRPMKCLDKPVKTTGKNKIPPAVPSKPPTPPYILGNPPFAKIEPFQVTGKTMLVWDAGSEHPYAEVWLSVNGGDETFVLERGKGALEVTLQLGLRYKYILTDAGTKLATVELQAVP